MTAQAEILLVDDDEDLRRSVAAILAAEGYAVREAADGRSGLAISAASPPALVLLDVSMPDLDGLETLRRLRARDRDVPVILLTASRLDPESIGVGLELGAEEYLGKPIRPDELIARIRALLRLRAARRELEVVKRDQTAMLVHDLKQPLSIITLRAELVADESVDPELRRSGRAIRDACRQMEQLINSVLELSRIEAGQMRLSRAPCDLTEVAVEVVEQLRGIAERRGIALACAAQPSPPLFADRPKLVQVLQNLLGNALKFTPAGGRIDVTLAISTGALTLTVEDTGCGLSPDGGARLFDKWQQSRAGRARGGSGLGLAIARAIVLAHGGAIGASDREDGRRGARFYVVLPLSAEGAAEAAL